MTILSSTKPYASLDCVFSWSPLSRKKPLINVFTLLADDTCTRQRVYLRVLKTHIVSILSSIPAFIIHACFLFFFLVASLSTQAIIFRELHVDRL